MLIGIEATRANKNIKTGVEWYAWNVIQALKDVTGVPGKLDSHSWILYANDILRGGLERLPENWYEVRIPWPIPYGWTQFRLAYELYKHHIDVLWMPGSTLPRYHPPRTVVTIHDIGFHHVPHLYKSRQVHIHERAMKEVARKAARIITVSEFSAREMVESYGIDARKIAITPLGVNHATYRPILEAETIEECLRRCQVPRPFFIAIGRLEAKKNIVTLIKAFTLFKERRGVGDPYHLVLVGTRGFGYEDILKEIRRSSAREHILELGYVPEVDLPYLLNGAEALCHPSLYEGFGIPPLEAMACGCPVVASNTTSLPEVCGDAALLVSPLDVEAWVAALNRFVGEMGLVERLRMAGIARAAGFTWQATAEKTLPVLTAWE